MNYRAVIAFLATKHQKTWVDSKSSLLETVGYENYTDDVIKELEEMYAANEIDIRPVRHNSYGGVAITWLDKDDAWSRPDNLPAFEGDPSGRDKGKLIFRVHGADTRTDGPSRVLPADRTIEWWLDDSRVAVVRVVASRKIMEIYLDGHGWSWFRDVNGWKQYRDLIKQKFPEAGDKIWPWDYMSVKPLPQKTINEWKQQIGV